MGICMSEAVTAPSLVSVTLSPDRLFIDAFRWMLLARRLEEKLASLYHAGKIVGGVYLGRGQEAFSVSIGMSLRRGKDVFGPLIRDMAGRLAFGQNLLDPARTSLGSVLGPMRGRDGNVHWGRPREGMPAMISHLGSLISVVCGMLVARRFRGETDVAGVASIGEGGTSTGSFHEALNLAAVEKLPLVVAVANNQVRVLDAHFEPVRLRSSRGPRRRLWGRWPYCGWDRSGRLPGGDGSRCRAGAGGPRSATGDRQHAPPDRPRRT